MPSYILNDRLACKMCHLRWWFFALHTVKCSTCSGSEPTSDCHTVRSWSLPIRRGRWCVTSGAMPLECRNLEGAYSDGLVCRRRICGIQGSGPSPIHSAHGLHGKFESSCWQGTVPLGTNTRRVHMRSRRTRRVSAARMHSGHRRPTVLWQPNPTRRDGVYPGHSAEHSGLA